MGYKQARRREDDIAIVNAGFRVLFEPHLPQYIVKEISLCYGGMSYITVSASKTEKSLLGRYMRTCVYRMFALNPSIINSIEFGMTRY